MPAKYVVVRGFEGKLDSICVFPASVMHSDMRVLGEIIGAGFVNCGICTGSSESLGVDSRPDDQELYDLWIRSSVMEVPVCRG